MVGVKEGFADVVTAMASVLSRIGPANFALIAQNLVRQTVAGIRCGNQDEVGC